jgi:integrase
MVESGCDLPTLAALLGHSSLRMVMKYVHPTEAHQAQVLRNFEAAERKLARQLVAVDGGRRPAAGRA